MTLLKKFKLIPYLVLLTAAITLTGCQKEGCTDPNSRNYDSDAKKNNGNCLYEGQVVIWYGKKTAQGLVDDGATSLMYYVDGQLVGSSAASVYWTKGPECGQNSSITITKDLGHVNNKSYMYSVKDQTGWEYWKGVLNFSANTCEAVELVW